jgi:type I restriction enzyme, S subunit
MSWNYSTVGEESSIVTKGTTPTSIGLSFAELGVPFLRVQNVNGKNILMNDVLYISEEANQTLSRSIIHGNDVLISIAGTIGRSAVVPLDAPPMNCNQALAIVRLKDTVNPHFFCHWLESEDARKQIAGKKVTATISNLSLTQIRGLKIPVPPLSEQIRITAILDLVDDTEISINIIHNSKQQLIRSTFLEMFGDMLTNPMNWPVMKLGEVCESQLGKAISNEAKLCKAPSKYLRNENVKWRKIEFHDLKEMDFKDSEKHKLTLHDGDVLATEGGNVGRCAIWKYGNQNIYFQNSLHRIRVNLDVLTPEYLVEYFSIMSERGGLIRETTQVTIAHLTGHKLKQLPLPLPPLVLQQKFIRILKQIRVLSEENLTQSQNLNLSLKQEMLT